MWPIYHKTTLFMTYFRWLILPGRIVNIILHELLYEDKIEGIVRTNSLSGVKVS